MAEAVPRQRKPNVQTSPWAEGATVFAGSVMLVVGFMQFFEGLIALINGNDFLVNTPNYALRLDTTAWGWTHLILGALVAVAGAFIFTGNAAARGFGVFLAGLSVITNFLWLPYYPFWALVVLSLNVFVIWGLTTSNLGNAQQPR
jgi:hypothetical protein